MRLVAAVVFTVGLFLVLPAMVLCLRYWLGLERHEGDDIAEEEVPMMWVKWAFIIAISGMVVFGLPFLLATTPPPGNYIGVYVLAALGGATLLYLILSHVMADTLPPHHHRSRGQPLTPEERNRLVRARIEQLRRRQAQGEGNAPRAANRGPLKQPEFKGVPSEVIATFPFRIWAPPWAPDTSLALVTDPSILSAADPSDAEIANVLNLPSSRPVQNRLTLLRMEEGALPGSIPSSSKKSVPADREDPSFASNVATPTFKQRRASSRILSVLNRPVKSRLFSLSFSKKKVAPAEDGPCCPICLEEFQEGEEVSTMPCFGHHEFHRACIGDWMKAHRNCPVCRGELWDGVSKAAANAAVFAVVSVADMVAEENRGENNVEEHPEENR